MCLMGTLLYHMNKPRIFITCVYLQNDCLDTKNMRYKYSKYITIRKNHFRRVFVQQINTNIGLSMTDRIVKRR